MREYGRRVVALTCGLRAESLLGDAGWGTRAARERTLFIVGEAANRVPREVQAEHQEIPWPAIIGLRNLLAHGYETIEPQKLWLTTTISVPELLHQPRCAHRPPAALRSVMAACSHAPEF
jgi:uncharacterized protein with HEPN domain